MSRAASQPLRIKAFRALWIASVVGYLGGFLHTVAASWLMLELTGSALWVGLMAGSSTLPVLLLALPAGVVADLVDRRKVVVFAHALMAVAALAMAVLRFTGRSSPGWLLGLGLVLGTGVAFNLPVSHAIVPDLVPRGLVADAVAINSAGFNVARALGPAIGGVVVVVAGPGTAFVLNAASYVVTIVAMRRVRVASDTEEESSVSSAIAIGLRFVRFTPLLRWLLGLVAAFALTSAVIQAVLPNLTSDVLDGGAGSYGVLLGAMGAGALVGTATRRQGNRLLGSAMIPFSVVGVGLAGIVAGLSRSQWLTGTVMIVAGVFWIWVLVTLAATAQLLAPDWVRGRVMSLYSMVYPSFVPLGAIFAGALGDAIGVGATMTALSATVVLLGLIALRAPLPAPDGVVTPQRSPHEHLHQDQPLRGGPVMVTNTWRIHDNDLGEFLDLMDQLRVLRLRSGAYRWQLYRGAGDPHVMQEVFLVRSWDDHLRQHRRTEPIAPVVLDRTRVLDRVGGPVTQHLVAVEVADPDQRPGRFADLVPARDGVHDSVPADR
ncbi:MAG: MFS transporter [Jiangellaceae bacterium]